MRETREGETRRLFSRGFLFRPFSLSLSLSLALSLPPCYFNPCAIMHCLLCLSCRDGACAAAETVLASLDTLRLPVPFFCFLFSFFFSLFSWTPFQARPPGPGMNSPPLRSAPPSVPVARSSACCGASRQFPSRRTPLLVASAHMHTRTVCLRSAALIMAAYASRFARP